MQSACWNDLATVAIQKCDMFISRPTVLGFMHSHASNNRRRICALDEGEHRALPNFDPHVCRWLESEDYPKILGAADIGHSIHVLMQPYTYHYSPAMTTHAEIHSICRLGGWREWIGFVSTWTHSFGGGSRPALR